MMGDLPTASECKMCRLANGKNKDYRKDQSESGTSRWERHYAWRAGFTT